MGSRKAVLVADDYPPQRSIDAGDVPGNPLRSYRLAMLGHGFVDDAAGDEFKLDESDAIGYSLLRIRKERLSLRAALLILVMVAVVAGVLIAALA
jgi:hypothetical protein